MLGVACVALWPWALLHGVAMWIVGPLWTAVFAAIAVRWIIVKAKKIQDESKRRVAR